MSFLSAVTKGKVKRPHFLVIYGPDGVGKSTFAADAPNPIFLGAESGTDNLDTSRLSGMTSFEAICGALKELAAETHPYKTVVIDSLDWLEALVWDYAIRKHGKPEIKAIEDFGFGKGYGYALDSWRQIIPLVSAIRDKGLNFIAIAHSKIKLFQDPATPQGYERYQLKLHDSAAALWREAVDSVLFTNYVTHTSSEDKKRGFSDGTRAIWTERRPGWDAKNRNGLPFQLPLSWDDYVAAMEKGDPSDTATLLGQIEGLKSLVQDKSKLPAIEAAIKSAKSTTELAKIKNRMEALTGGGK